VNGGRSFVCGVGAGVPTAATRAPHHGACC
jgi:hypothetical protein